MVYPVQSESEARAHDTFTALMQALSRPGRVQTFSGKLGAFEAVSEALLDLETTFFTPDHALETHCRTLGARFTLPQRADYLLFPVLEEAGLHLLEHASVGTLLYPDQSTTLVLGATFSGSSSLKLSGPGIQLEENISVDGISRAFWTLRNEKVRFPLGWDLILLEVGALSVRVIGLPRSTRIEVL